MAGRVGLASLRPCPAHGVVNYTLNGGMMINGIGLVPGTEIEDASAAARPAVAAAENFSPLEPGNKNLLLGVGNAERLPIHLGLFQFDATVNPFGDGVAGIYRPNAF